MDGTAERVDGVGARPRILPRVVVYGLLACVVAMTAAEATLWPLSSWQLFSYVRRPEISSIVVTTESPEGVATIAPSSIWREYRGLPNAIEAADRTGRVTLDQICDAILDGVREQRPDTNAVVISEFVTDRSLAGSEEDRVVERTPLVRCGWP